MGLTKFSLLRRRSGIDHAKFLAHWHTVHVDVLINRGRHKHYNFSYIQNDFQSQSTQDDLVFDGAAQMLPRSNQFVHNGFQQDPLYAQFVRPDEQLFLSPERCVVLYCQSTALGNIHSAVNCRKIFCLVRRSASAHTDAFDQGWQARAQHLLVSHAAQGLSGIRQHRVLPGAATNMGHGLAQEQPIDWVEELFFKHDQSLNSFLSSSCLQDSFGMNGAMPLGEGSHAFVAQERLVYEEPA